MIDYPFTEFEDHFLAITTSLGDEQVSFGKGVFKILNHMKAYYTDPKEQNEKATCFVKILMYLVDNIDNFNTKDYCIETDDFAVISPHLRRSVHHFFTQLENESPDPNAVMELADKFKSEGQEK